MRFRLPLAESAANFPAIFRPAAHLATQHVNHDMHAGREYRLAIFTVRQVRLVQAAFCNNNQNSFRLKSGMAPRLQRASNASHYAIYQHSHLLPY